MRLYVFQNFPKFSEMSQNFQKFREICAEYSRCALPVKLSL